MAKDNRMQSGILGDINPTDAAKNDRTACRPPAGAGSDEIEAMEGGSKHDRSEHSGSRDVLERLFVHVEQVRCTTMQVALIRRTLQLQVDLVNTGSFRSLGEVALLHANGCRWSQRTFA